MNKKLIAIIIVLIVATAGYFVLQKFRETPKEKEVRAAVEDTLANGSLSNPNEQIPENVKLISVSVKDNEVKLNFSKDIISKGQVVFEDTFSIISNAIDPIVVPGETDPEKSGVRLIILIEGKPIGEVL